MCDSMILKYCVTIMNDEQYKRYRKMNADPIQCLYQTHDKNKNIYFLISGSSGTKYKVTITPKGKIECSCPDYKHTAVVQECVCKHCLFVIFHVLRLFKDVDHTFFKRCYFTPDEIKNVHGAYKELKRKK
jgi:hypothetical protein